MKRFMLLALLVTCSMIASAAKPKDYLDKANSGDPVAQWNLANCYYMGQGTSVDLEQALFWYQKSADSNYLPAICDMGLCYYFGKGVEQNYKTALEFFMKAAKQGFAGAQYNVGVCYHNGDGIEADINQAIYWYNMAAKQGYEPAIILLNQISSINVEPK